MSENIFEGRGAYKKSNAKEKYEGLEFKTKYGTPFIVKEYINAKNIIIEFPFSGIQKKTRLDKLISDSAYVGDPFYGSNGKHRPFVFKNPEKEYLGCVFQNYYGEKFKIIEYKDYNNITVEFMDEHRYRVTTDYGTIKSGCVRNPYRINFAGGYVGEHNMYIGKEYGWLNRTWHDVLIRANRKDKLHKRNRYSYDNCTISPEWLDYGNFTRDYMNKLSELNPNFKYTIDKDLLYPYYKDNTNGMKYYSNETTVLLPNELNNLVERIMNNKLLVKNTYDYTHRYQAFLNFIDRVTWYKENNGLTDIAFRAFIELINNKIEEMKQKFPEYERIRLERI